MYPFHLRLSIHAHTNSGPKFGIRLLSNENCKLIKSLKDNEPPRFDDLLHIPTPWHNCVIRIEDEPFNFIGKSSIAQNAVNEKTFTGEWVPGDLEAGEGGYYRLWKLPTAGDSVLCMDSQLFRDQKYPAPLASVKAWNAN